MAKRPGKGVPPKPESDPPAPLEVVWSGRFKRDVERMRRSGRDMAKLTALMTAIAEGRRLEPSREDHPLRGDWKGYRDCHVEGDWVLVYKVAEGKAWFARTGTHSEVFGR